jgi:acetyl esterase
MSRMRSAAAPTLAQRGEARTARAMAKLPRAVQRALAGRPVRIDGQELDPGIQLMLRARRARGRDALFADEDTTADARRLGFRQECVALVRRPTPVAGVAELEVDGGAGRLRARHYSPREHAGLDPLLVFLHGGGWTVGDLDTHDEACRMLCRHAGVHVLSVDYRLAPEHPFPAAVDDALAAWRWAQANAARLGADPERVAIGGDSAGGNLSAVVAQALARDGGPAPTLQVLIYAATDLADRSRPSSTLFGEGFVLTNRDRDWCERQYQAADPADPRVSPLRAESLAGTAAAIVVTAAFDPLRDEGEAYAQALREMDVPVATFRAEGLIHGFLNLTTVNRASRDAVLVLAGMIRAAL